MRTLGKIFWSAIGLAASLVTATAFAAGDDEITMQRLEQQAQESGATHLMAKLFGSWVLDIHGSGAADGVNTVVTPVTLFAALVGVAGWTLFMLLAGYVGVVGLVRTAQQGEFMGKDWNSTWVLARLLGALVLSAPLGTQVTAGGTQLAAGQVLVVRAAILSASAADIIWGKTLQAIGRERISSDRSMHVNVNFSVDQALSVIEKGYEHGVCFGSKIAYDRTFNEKPEEVQKRLTESYARECKMDWETLDLNESRVLGSVDLQSKEIARGTVGRFDTYHRPEQLHRNSLIRSKAFEVSVNYYRQALRLGQHAGQSLQDQGPYRAALRSLAESYHDALKREVEELLQASYRESVNMFSEDAARYGWISAGSYYRALASQQAQINAALNESLSVGGSRLTPESLQSNLPSDDYVYANTKRAITMSDVQDNGWLGKLKDKVASAFFDMGRLSMLNEVGLNLLTAGDTKDPLVTASTIGHALSSVGLLGFLPAMGALQPIFYVGVILGDVLPSLPWVIFMFGTLSWLIHVTEMFISAPLWIAAHAAPEGREHTSHLASKGYDNMLFIMLYPILAIGGFITAMGVCWIGMYLLNNMIAQQFMTQLGGGFTAILHMPGTLVGFALLYLWAAWTIVTASFNLIHAFPRTILNWLSTSSPGHDAFSINPSHITNSAGMMKGAVGGTVATALVLKNASKRIGGGVAGGVKKIGRGAASAVNSVQQRAKQKEEEIPLID